MNENRAGDHPLVKMGVRPSNHPANVLWIEPGG